MAAPIFLAATAISAVSSIAGGVSANSAARREGALLDEQGRLSQEESDREAQLHADDVRRFSKTQSLAFLKNGVTLAGSPLLTVQDSVARGQEEVDSISKSGAAQRTLYNQRAEITRNQGRAALIGGIGQAAGTAASGYATGKKAGLFG